MEDRTRMWGASKELTEIMGKPVKDSDVMWETVELLMPGLQLTVWSRDDENSFLNLNAELNPDDICPEGDVIKQFWRILYEGIERITIHENID